MIDAWQRAVLAEGELYRVGGVVRDRLRGASDPSVDVDYLARGIEPERLEQILRALGKLSLVGRSFGVYKFTPGDGSTVDIVYPRLERSTGPGHREFDVHWDWQLPVEADLRRRDFTVNAVAEEVETGRIIDPCGGRGDIDAGLIRMIFAEAFAEDPLRILRGVRFAVRFDFEIETETRRRMEASVDLLRTLSAERVQEELGRLLTECERPSPAFILLHEIGALAVILPELDRCAGVEQNEYHPDDVFIHSLKTLDAAPRDDLVLRWAALLHDIGKVDARQQLSDERGERVVFYGHELIGEQMSRKALSRLRCPNDTTATVASLVREHMFNYEPDWTDATVRRFIRRVGEERLDRLFGLREADCRSRGLDDRIENARHLRERVETELREARTFKIRDLAVDGRDVMRVTGMEGGAGIGRILKQLLERVIDDPALNERARLLEIIREVADAEGPTKAAKKGAKKGKSL